MARARWGRDFLSQGPIKTVPALKRLAERLLARVHPTSRMAAAAKFALQYPDAVLARPELQRELEDMAKRYANPYGPRARYKHKRIRSPRRFKRGSFRLTGKRGGVRVVVGKLRGERRRVKGRARLTAQAILTPKRKRGKNPAVYSERKAWQAVRIIGKRIGGEDGAALEQLAEYMLEQLARGVHLNPTLAVFGANPPGKVGSGDVQAILYRHAEDGRDYVHPFGKGITATIRRDGATVVRASADARSGVKAIGLKDGSVLLKHPTKPIWKDF